MESRKKIRKVVRRGKCSETYRELTGKYGKWQEKIKVEQKMDNDRKARDYMKFGKRKENMASGRINNVSRRMGNEIENLGILGRKSWRFS